MSEELAANVIYTKILSDTDESKRIIEKGIREGAMEKSNFDSAILTATRLNEKIGKVKRFFRLGNLDIDSYNMLFGTVGNPNLIITTLESYGMDKDAFQQNVDELVKQDNHEDIIVYTQGIINSEGALTDFFGQKLKGLERGVKSFVDHKLTGTATLKRVVEKMKEELNKKEPLRKIAEQIEQQEREIESLKVLSIGEANLDELIEKGQTLPTLIQTLQCFEKELSTIRREIARLLDELGEFYIALVEVFSEKGYATVKDVLLHPELRRMLREDQDPTQLLKALSEQGLLDERYYF